MRLKGQGHINLHKTQAPSRSLPENPRGSFQRPGPHRAVAPNRSSSWQIHRPAPYSRTRARPGKKVANPHRNKTLVLNKTTNSSQSPKDSLDVSNSSTNDAVYSDADRDNSTKPMTSWVTKHDRHMQLIKSSIFNKETQLRNKAIDQTRRQKSLQRNLHERNKIQRHLQSLSTSAHSSPHELTINGIPFHVLDGGSKLSRVHSEYLNLSVILLRVYTNRM